MTLYFFLIFICFWLKRLKKKKKEGPPSWKEATCASKHGVKEVSRSGWVKSEEERNAGGMGR